jgi:hypothetical protein
MTGLSNTFVINGDSIRSFENPSNSFKVVSMEIFMSGADKTSTRT